MSRKISIKHIIYALLFFSILINNGFFHIVDSTSRVMDILQLIVLLILIGIVFFYYNWNTKVSAMLKGKWIYLLYTFFFLICQFISCCYINGNSVTEFFSNGAMTYVYLLLFPVLTCYLVLQGNIRQLMETIEIITFIIFAYVFFVAVIENFTGSSIMQFPYYLHTKGIKNGRLRFWDLSVFTGIVSMYSFNEAINVRGKKKKFHTLVAVLLFIDIIYIEQSRAVMIAVVVSYGLVLVLNITNPKTKILLYFIGIVFGCGVLLGGGQAIPILQSFSTTGEFGLQTTVRIAGIQYAIEQFMAHPFVGYGMNYAAFKLNYNGLQFLYSHIDIGVVGSLSRLGIVWSGIYVLPMVRYAKFLIKGNKRQYLGVMGKEYGFLVGLYIYLLITSISYLVTDAVRIYAWPFYMAIFEFFIWRVKHEKVLLNSVCERNSNFGNNTCAY